MPGQNIWRTLYKQALHLGYLVLNVFFQALHKISLREQVCTVRVCEVVLSLASTLIDLGVLANNSKALLLSSLVKADNSGSEDDISPPAAATASAASNEANKDKLDENSSNQDNESKEHSPSPQNPNAVQELSLHNTLMDIVVR